MKQELTELFVKNLKAHANKRLEITDAKIPGLTLRVTPAGKKTFSFAYRMPGNNKAAGANRNLPICIYKRKMLGIKLSNSWQR